MSNWSGGGKRRATNKGWRAQDDATSAPAPQWQTKSSIQSKYGGSSGRGKGLWFFYSLLGALLLGLFLYVLLSSPARTPMLLVQGTSYSAPVHPNQWVHEDRDALKELSNSLSIFEISEKWVGEDSPGWEEFRQQLEDHSDTRSGFRRVHEPLVIYFSMPGVVDENGNPCLLPPGASPLNSEDWVTIDSILDAIAKTVPDRPKLLIFDSNQELINWNMGIVYNTFTERLKQFVDEQNVPNLAVLTTADEGQVSWSSPQIQGTVFGQFLRLGLAGAADKDEDDEVTLNEVVEYLQTEVGTWAQSNRNSKQQPVLIKSSPDLDFLITHVVIDDEGIDAYQQALADGAESQPSISVETIAGLWSQLDQLKALDLVRYDPITLGEYEGELLRLERLAYGGMAYTDEAEGLVKSIASRFKKALAGVKSDSPALADHLAITSEGDTGSTRITEKLDSIPLRLYFGQEDQANSTRDQEFLKKLLGAVNGIKPKHAPSDAALIQSVFALPETQFLVAAQQQQVNQNRDNPQYLLELLKLRKRAEQLVVPGQGAGDQQRQDPPGDERAHYYVRFALNSADKVRRRAEDDLFVTEPIAGREQLVSEAGKAYKLAQQIQDQTTDAFRTSDRAWAESPYLAEWFCRPGKNDSPPPSQDEINDILSLIRSNHNLGETIGGLRDIPLGESTREKVVGQIIDPADVSDVKEKLQQLSVGFLEQCNKLVKAKDTLDAKGMLALESVLATPLTASALRKDLLECRDELAYHLHLKKQSIAAESLPADSATEQSTQDDDASASLAETIAEWNQSPLIAILAPEISPPGSAPKSETLQRLENDCWTARKKLRDFKKLNVEDTPTRVAANGSNTFLDDRLSLSDTEGRVRAAASLGFERLEKDPISQLRLFDLQQLLLWHTQRVLDDFWHTVAPSNATSIDELLAPPTNSAQVLQPSYAATAANYLRYAEEIYPSLPQGGVKQKIKSLEQLRQRRLEASEHGLRLIAESRPVLGSPSNIDVAVQVEANPQGPDLPSGEAAIYFANEGVRLDNVTPTDAIALPIADGQSIPQNAQARNVKSDSLDAVVFFRGRQYRQPFRVNNLAGAVVEYDYPQYDRQSVQLRGNQPSPPAVVFILDCSYSMEQPIMTERGSVPQMQVAKSELERMLNELSERRASPPQVGVLFFGHRVGWFTDTRRINRRPEAAKGPIPPNLHPGDDVEQILSLGILDPVALGEVRKRLEKVTFHGLTPVNLSIVKALDEFDGKAVNFSKSIIVITDGKNDQTHVASSGLNPPNNTTTDEVIAAWKRNGKKIPVYIVGFGMKKDEAVEAARDFKRIAEETGGDWFPANSGAELIEFLRNQLKVHGYVVNALVDGSRIPLTRDEDTKKEVPVPLYKLVPVPSDEIPLPADVEIEFQSLSKQVQLEGGEALVLRVNSASDDIGPEPYRDGVEEEVPLIDGDSTTYQNLRLQVHRAKRTGSRVDFRFSVQDQYYHYTPRPKEIWVEISPQNSQQTYLFYDAVYDPDTPVPVVSFSIPNWPRDKNEAVVKFWCNYEPTKSAPPVQLSDVEDLESPQAVFKAVPGVQGVEVHIGLQNAARDEYKVLVDEEYAKGTPLGTIRVGLNIPDPSLRPKSVSHLFDARNGIARHQFTFESGLSKQEFLEKISVEIADGAAVKQHSFKLAEPGEIKIPIRDANSTHDPGAVSAESL